MARKKKTGSKPKPERGHGTIPQTVEGMDDDRLAALTFTHQKKYVTALAAKKKADADLKNVCKIAKADLGATAIDDIKDLIALDADKDGGTKLLSERVQRLAKVARWGGAAIQLDMFKPAPAGRAAELGKAAGLRGDPAKPPYAPGTAEYNDWLSAHGEGNAALARSGIKSPTPTSSQAKGADSGLMPMPEWKKEMQRIEQVGKDVIKGGAPSTAQVHTS